MTVTRAERIEGAMWGLLVGDALGVPYEFHPPKGIPPFEAIEMEPPAGFDRAHAVPAGTWSDDGAHALCLLASLLERGGLDLDDLGARLLRWYEHGYMAPDARVFDIGVQTGQALRALRGGTSAERAGPADERSNGNGSLMRVLPLALWHRGTDAELVRDARRQSLVTHGHLRSQMCCALYCVWVRRELAGDTTPWEGAVATLRAAFDDGTSERTELERSIRPDDPPSGSGSGYVVDCLRSARLVALETDYERVVRAAIALGNDTDTTACVAGGIAGARWGVPGIPSRWLDALRGRELAAPWITRLARLPSYAQ